MLEWLGLLVLVLVGAAAGYFLGKGSASSSSTLPARHHHTISFDAKRHAEDAELDTEMAARDQADGGGDAVAAAESGIDAAKDQIDPAADEEEFPAYDASDDDEDLQTTLAHMKQEHAAHLEQFNEATAAAAGSPVSDSSSTSPPAPFPQRRRIFIIAKSLPLHITNITGLPTPSATPMGSPMAGPMSDPSALMGFNASAAGSSSTADSMDGAFSLDGSGAAAAASASPAAPVNSFDQARRPSLAGFSGAGADQLPCSRVVEHGGARFKVEWEDSRSFLSNLRCLLTPPAAAAAANAVPGAPVSPTPTPASMPDGLAAAVPPASSTLPTDSAAPEVTWIGVSSVSDSRAFKTPEERAAYEATLRENHCVPVYLDKELQEGYASFCKSILWPLLHYMMPTSSNENVGPLWQAYWDSYLAANQLFADRICAEMASPKDIIWIHNMHLFSLPKLIRSKVPRATIGLFIHTPFPSSDVFRSLPSRREILESMMESDLLGFHTFDYARHFLSCIKRVLDLDFETLSGGVLGVRYNGRFISILISHVGIQSHVFQEAASSELIRHRVEKLRKKHEGKKIIVGVDDVDVAKAPLLKLQAFDRFLSRHSEWVSKIVILEMFLPSKNMDSALGIKIQRDLDAYVIELKRKYGQGIIEIITPEPKGARAAAAAAAAAIEPPAAMVRGSSDQLQLPAPTALHKSNSGAVARSDPHEVSSGLKLLELVRLYNAADVAIISTFFDGLNLIPYECTASQSESGSNTAPCALIISEFMGCSRSLNGVLRVNPWSLEMISDTLHQALNMSADERRANHARRFNYVMNHTIEKWARGFLDHLEKATKLGAELNYVAVGSGASHKLLGLKHNFVHLPMQTLANTYSSASLRVILLDYDGTLVAADKSAGAGCAMDPPVGVLRLLKFLADQPNTVVFLMSGRTRAVLAEWFGDNPNLGLAAEKGLFLRWPANLARECRFDKSVLEESEIERRERKLEQKQREDREREAARRNASEDDDESDSSVSSSDDDEDSDSDSESSGPRASPPIPSPSPLVGAHDWECIVPLDDISWKAAALEIIRSYTEQTDGSWIEDKEFAIVWHYEQADVEYGRMQASDLQKYLVKVLANPAVDVLRYDKSRILEVKPHGVNKGLAATAILESLWIMHEKQTQAAQAAAVASQGTPIASAVGATTTPNTGSSTPQLPVAPRGFGSTSPLAAGSATPGSATLSPRSQVTSFHPFVLAIGDDRSDEDMFVAVLQKMYLDGRVRGRGRESAPYVDTFPRSAALTSSTVPTSIPPTPSHMMHDRELSPTPMSPSLSGGPHHRSLRGAPSADPLLFTVCVGVKPSSAQYYVNDVEGVLRSLYGLVLRDYEDRPPSAVSPSSGETSPRFGLTKRGPGASSGVRRGSTDASSSGGGGMGPKRSSFATLLFGNKAVESKE